MGTADAIVDLVSSGTTLRENNLKEIEGGVVLESQVDSIVHETSTSFQLLLEVFRASSVQLIVFDIGYTYFRLFLLPVRSL